MGRAYTQPEVMDNGMSFQIQRTANPEDEFASTEVLCLEGGALVWREEGNHLPFPFKTEADMFLLAFHFGRETAREEIARSLA